MSAGEPLWVQQILSKYEDNIARDTCLVVKRRRPEMHNDRHLFKLDATVVLPQGEVPFLDRMDAALVYDCEMNLLLATHATIAQADDPIAHAAAVAALDTATARLQQAYLIPYMRQGYDVSPETGVYFAQSFSEFAKDALTAELDKSGPQPYQKS